MSAIKIIQGYARKSLTTNKGSGITTIPGAMQSEAKAAEIVALLQRAGIPMNQLDDFIRSEADVAKFLNIIEAASKPKVYSGQAAVDQLNKLFPKKGEVVEFPQKTSFKEQVEAMKKSGDIVDPNNLKKNNNVLTRELFRDSTLNKEPVNEKFIKYTIQDINKKDPIEGMKIANKIIKREGEFKDLTEAQSQRILKETDDHLTGRDMDYDPEDFYAKGGRAGYAVGNQVMPAIDPGMNLDYNTLVNQNTAQRSFMKNWRDHATASQAMKGKAGLESIPNYGMQSGYDFQKKFNYNPKTAAVLGAGYQLATEGLGMFNPKNPNFLNPIGAFKTAQSDATKNIEGILAAESNNLTAEQQADRNKYLERVGQPKDPVIDQDRISEIVEQQKAAGVPDEGLITNFKPTMADVAGPSPDAAETYSEYKARMLDTLRKSSNQKTTFTDLQPDGSFSGTSRELPQEDYYNYMLADAYGHGFNPITGFQFGTDDRGVFTNKYKFNQEMADFKKNNPDYNFVNLAKGGRAGFYTGGITDVEPSLDDIGHGTDALMSRTRLMSPGAQATTSTGLNYLLAEDNDNMRVPFAGGGPTRQGFKMGKRAFLKLLGSGFAGIAGLKSGLFGLGKKDATKQIAKELTSVPIGNPEGMPVWFKPLVNKIIKEGDDVTKKFGTVDREIVHTKKIDKFEEVTVYQDLNTGNVRLEYGPHLTDDTGKVIRASNEPTVVQLEYKAPEVLEPNLTTGKSGGKTKEEFYAAESEPEIVNWDGDIEMSGINEVNKVDDLITDTSKLQKYATDNKLTIKELSDSMKKQKYKNKLETDLGEQVNYIENKSGMNAMDYIDEGTRVGDFDPKGYRNYDTKGINLPEKKADGGRIGFSAGKTVLSKLGINSTSRRFLEKIFGKEGFENMIQNDPRMHRGMLEVVEMFRNRDKEGLKMYLQKFMPNMDDTEIEKFIIGDSGTEGIEGQLIRLGSGREYENLIKMSKEADQIRKLDDFDIDGVSKNAEGGRIGLFLGGGATAGKGLAREMLKFMTKGSSNAKTPAEILKMMNPKQFEKLLDNPAMLGKISPQTGQSANEMIIEMIKKTKDDRSSMVGDLIGSARKIKKVDDNIIAYKKKIIKDMIDGGIDEDTAYAFAEKMAKEMKEAAAPQLTASPPKITEQGLLELENIQKNLLTKDRKLQATGGLTTMLGE